MKKNLFFIAIIMIVAAASCVKDRTPPVIPPVVTPTGDTLMYYWSFYQGDSSDRSPAFGVNTGGTFSYWSAYIDYLNPSGCDSLGLGVNASFIADTGYALRVRNPSDSVVFYMPTTGFDSVILTFAEEASSTTSGSTNNLIRYTTDGIHYISAAFPSGSNQYSVGTSWALQTFSFAADPSTNNNPKFAVSIVMTNNNTGTSGNDRIDNLSLTGVRK